MSRSRMAANGGTSSEAGRPGEYRRDRFTWAAFGALLAFGFLNAVLGPALPFLRETEGISYVVAALHQVAFAVGGGLAGLLASRTPDRPSRPVVIRVGLLGAAIAGIGVGYGATAVTTVSAAFLVSLLGTSALVRLWAALADVHRGRRTIALTEGEVAVSLGGITAPLLVAWAAGSALTWRFAFVAGALVVLAAVLVTVTVPIPRSSTPRQTWSPHRRQHEPPSPPVIGRPPTRRHRGRPPSTLVIVFAVVAFEFTLSFWLASYLDDSVGLSRELAVAMVAGLYAANLIGRLVASRLAHRLSAETVLAVSLGTALAGVPILLAATDAVVAGAGLVVCGAGIAATFPLTSSLHIATMPDRADRAMGQVLATAAVGQILGPLTAGVLAQHTGLRLALLSLAVLAAAAVLALARHRPSPRCGD